MPPSQPNSPSGQRPLDALTLPAAAREQLLPRLEVSILEFCAFKLPVIVPVVRACTRNIADFFSRSPASVTDYATLRNIPAPRKDTIDALRAAAPSMLRAGHESLVCAHLTQTVPRTVPIYMLDFWDEVDGLRRVQQVWQRAEERLRGRRRLYEKEKGGSSNAVIQQTYDMLGITPWYGLLRGGREPEPIVMLAGYLLPNTWLGTAHENQMMELLQSDL
ncbi:hypothetical protein PENSPDRAFT_595407, partial [Peniophora sp. CONT]